MSGGESNRLSDLPCEYLVTKAIFPVTAQYLMQSNLKTRSQNVAHTPFSSDPVFEVVMTAVFDDKSESYTEFVRILLESSVVEPDDRAKLLLLAPFFTEDERDTILVALRFEVAQREVTRRPPP